jgi:hypothetical protein
VSDSRTGFEEGYDLEGLPLTLTNVVCGSLMCFYVQDAWFDNCDNGVHWKASDGSTLANLDSSWGGLPIYKPTNPNSTEIITIAPCDD